MQPIADNNRVNGLFYYRRLPKRPLKTNRRLANRGLTSLVKKAKAVQNKWDTRVNIVNAYGATAPLATNLVSEISFGKMHAWVK